MMSSSVKDAYCGLCLSCFSLCPGLFASSFACGARVFRARKCKGKRRGKKWLGSLEFKKSVCSLRGGVLLDRPQLLQRLFRVLLDQFRLRGRVLFSARGAGGNRRHVLAQRNSRERSTPSKRAEGVCHLSVRKNARAARRGLFREFVLAPPTLQSTGMPDLSRQGPPFGLGDEGACTRLRPYRRARLQSEVESTREKHGGGND